MRGAGTSIAGNAVGPGLVVDTARHLDRVLSLDPESRTAVVQPGRRPRRAPAGGGRAGLRFGPDPSTHSRCTIGGMIGNNACGSRALGYGRTSDNVAGMRVAFGTGEVATRGRSGPRRSRRCRRWSTASSGTCAPIRPVLRQVSGYALEHLLPENGRRLDRFLVGSEGTLGLVLEATVELVADEPRPPAAGARLPGMPEAADAVPALLGRRGPRRAGWSRARASTPGSSTSSGLADAACRPCRAAAGWLFVEVAGVDARGRAPGPRAARPGRWITASSTTRRRRPRCGGSGRTAPGSRPAAWPGRRTPAGRTPPSRPNAWAPGCASSTTCSASTVSTGCPTATSATAACTCASTSSSTTAGAGSASSSSPAPTTLRGYGGSLSGEHGDGRARSELLPLMYDERSLRLFAAAKAICDPDNLLNPGLLVDPAPLDADLRPPRPRAAVRTALRLTHDDGSLADAVHRCTGVGKCVAPHPGRRDVPVLARHPRGEGLDPWPRPRPPGGARRHAGPRTGRPGGARRPRPLPGLQGLRLGLPDRRRHGHLQGRGAAPAVRRPPAPTVATTRWAGCRLGRAAAPLAGSPTGCAAGPLGAVAKAVAGIDRRRSLPGARPGRRYGACRQARDPTGARRVDLGRHVHRPLPAADRATPRSGSSRPPGCASG